jgi:hypothetical protein
MILAFKVSRTSIDLMRLNERERDLQDFKTLKHWLKTKSLVSPDDVLHLLFWRLPSARKAQALMRNDHLARRFSS